MKNARLLGDIILCDGMCDKRILPCFSNACKGKCVKRDRFLAKLKKRRGENSASLYSLAVADPSAAVIFRLHLPRNQSIHQRMVCLKQVQQMPRRTGGFILAGFPCLDGSGRYAERIRKAALG